MYTSPVERLQIKNWRSWVEGQPFFEPLCRIARELETEVFLVGGMLRDRLFGRESRDADFVFSRHALAGARLFAERFGGTFVLLRTEGGMARVVREGWTFDFSDFRGPDLIADLQERDFTINTLCLPLLPSPTENPDALLDPFHGIKDLRQGILKTVSEASFRKDPLRLLRAFRLSVQLGLSLDPQTRRSLGRSAPLIQRCAPERVHHEMQLLLAEDASFSGLQGMEEEGLLGQLFPELIRLKGIGRNRYHHLDALAHSLLSLGRLERLGQDPFLLPPELGREAKLFFQDSRQTVWLKWAALFHDLGKAETAAEKNGETVFYGHPGLSRTLFEQIAHRYRMGRRERETIAWWIENHMRPFYLCHEERAGVLTRKALIRLIRDSGPLLNGLFLLAWADLSAAEGPEKTPDQEERLLTVWSKTATLRAEWVKPLQSARPLLTGKDLLALGLVPGPLFKRLLTELEEKRMAGEIENRAQALRWVAWKTGVTGEEG